MTHDAMNGRGQSRQTRRCYQEEGSFNASTLSNDEVPKSFVIEEVDISG
jgi:hypothetical protein